MRNREPAGACDGEPNGRQCGALFVRLLGPLEVSIGQHPIYLSAGRLRSLLAVMALSAGRTVSVDRLATAVWADGEPPGNARRSLQTYIARLRRVLGTESIGWTPTGYVLRAD